MGRIDQHQLVVKLKELANELGKTPTLLEFVASGVSKRQAQKYGYNELVKQAGLQPNKSAHTTEPVEVEITKPRVLIFDIEVSAKVAYTYKMWDANIGADNVIQDFYILAYSAKFLGEDKVYYLDTRYSPKCDLHILEALSHLINQATHLCGHNLARFDLPTLRARMIMKGVPPIPDLPVIDTLKTARRLFKFTSNKLGDLAKYLGLEVQKDAHNEFPGMSLFTEAMEGNLKAFEAMEHYCKLDSLVTEQVLIKLMPWDQGINFQSNYSKATCTCGNTKFFKNGLKHTRQGAFQIMRCSNCSKCFVDKNNLVPDYDRSLYFK